MITRLPNVKSVRENLSNIHQPIALVPTMGALHEGHLALLRDARKRVGPNGKVIISIFVNPIQFDRSSDLDNYPQPLEEDLALCEKEGVDFAFIPDKNNLYPDDFSVLVTESLLTQHLCGMTREGHFDGVLTIVLKLFNICQPNIAIFGKKDFQQLALIQRMARDLDLPIEIIGHPTVRENDGLALSSRNVRLTSGQRADAPRIQRALRAAQALKKSTDEQNANIYLETARSSLLKDAPQDFAIDYLQLVDAENLQPISRVTKPTFLATACFYGEIRLIDHISIS